MRGFRLFVPLFCAAAVAGCGAPDRRPDLVLITVDTLRADHLGCYGYGRQTSPAIDRLAASGIVFERGIAQAPWTLPSMASLHTSLYPREHGAVSARTPLASQLTTIAEALRAEGYETAALVTHTFVSRRYGMDQGFGTFDESLIVGPEGVTSDQLTEKALARLERRGDAPIFLWLHYFDPHFNYVRHADHGFADLHAEDPPESLSYRDLRAAEPTLRTDPAAAAFSADTARAIYDEEIAFTDAAIGRLAEGIDALGAARPTVTVFTADHGEYFMERGRFGHGRDVYDELIHVPLIVWGSIDEALRGLRVERGVEVASIARTLATLAGITDPPFQGIDLLALARGTGGDATVHSEGNYAWGTDERKIMVEREGWKLLRHLDSGRLELYSLDRDPAERDNLWSASADAAEPAQPVLEQALDRFARRSAAPAPDMLLSPEERAHLESLGYLGE